MTNLIDTVCVYSERYLRTRNVRPLKKTTNHVYRVGQEYVLKISSTSQPFAANEAFVLQIYNARGIPTPEVIRIDTTQCTFNADVLITRYIPHTQNRYAHNYAQMGQLLALMHTISIPGIGFIDPHTRTGTSKNWQEFLIQRIIPVQPYLEEATGKTLDELLPPLNTLPEYHTLLHRDYGRHNILFNCSQGQSNIISIIDPIGAIGDPFLDIAITILDLPTPYKQQFLQHYRPQGLTKKEEERLHTYTTLTLLQKLGFVRKRLHIEKGKTIFNLHRRQASYLARLKKEGII